MQELLPLTSRSHVSRGDLWHDIVAGLVVGIIALPLSIALAVAIGVPPVAGLYTAVFAGASAAILGGSNFNITGPTAALVPILSHTVLVVPRPLIWMKSVGEKIGRVSATFSRSSQS